MSDADHLPQHDDYGDDPRADVGAHIPRGATSALDVGCSRGGFGRTLRAALGSGARIVGVEATQAGAEAASVDHGYDEVLQGYFPHAFEGRDEQFEQIYFNDVLEHILDPWQVLRDTHAFLAPGGRVLAAIPSIQYFTAVKDLIRGRWDYTDAGTLDRTHVRFFTRATMVEMFEDTGYVVEQCIGLNSIVDAWRAKPGIGPAVKARLGRVLGDARYLQFLIIARSEQAHG